MLFYEPLADSFAHCFCADRNKNPPLISAVLIPSVNTCITALSIQSDSSDRPNDKRSIMAAESMVARGLARSLPAMSGAAVDGLI